MYLLHWKWGFFQLVKLVSFQSKFQYEQLKQLTSPCFQLQGKKFEPPHSKYTFPQNDFGRRFRQKHPPTKGSLLSFQPCIVFRFSFCSNFNPVLKVELRSGGHPRCHCHLPFHHYEPPRFLVTQRWRMNSRQCRQNHLSRVESFENLVTMLVSELVERGYHFWAMAQDSGQTLILYGKCARIGWIALTFRNALFGILAHRNWEWFHGTQMLLFVLGGDEGHPQWLSDNMTIDAYKVGPYQSENGVFPSPPS